MTMVGVCSVCGAPATCTCPICGKLVCRSCSHAVTSVCAPCEMRRGEISKRIT